jgi:hypothetical protein
MGRFEMIEFSIGVLCGVAITSVIIARHGDARADQLAKEISEINAAYSTMSLTHADEAKRFRCKTADFIRDREKWERDWARLNSELDSLRESVRYWKNAHDTKGTWAESLTPEQPDERVCSKCGAEWMWIHVAGCCDAICPKCGHDETHAVVKDALRRPQCVED